VPAQWFDDLAAAGRAGRVTLDPPGGSCGQVFAAVERIPELRAIHPDLVLAVRLQPPASRLAQAWTRRAAIAEILKGRLTLTGPVTAAALAEPLAVSAADAEEALLQLEVDGVVLRGRFTPGASSLEWCDRTLLARIHRATINRLRAEIAPVSPADFMRFLFRWQHVEPSSRLAGIDGLRHVLAVLDGYELAAAAWERTVLPARIDGYEPSMLDMLCFAGEAGWARLSAPAAAPATATLIHATPIALFLRDHAIAWRSLRTDEGASQPGETEPAGRVLAALRARGAVFFRDLRSACGLDADEACHALATLAAAGLATSDGFSGVRAILLAERVESPARDRHSRFNGRWSALESADGGRPVSRDEAVELQAWTLLRRYGVVCRRLLARETNAAMWRELARVYRRLEARGEIRGGRFVTGMSGEQFALADAVERLREVRRTPADGRLLAISAADPLNLTGIVTVGERIRSATRTRIVYRDGVPVAAVEGELVRELAPIDSATVAEVRRETQSRRTPAFALR
jgi:ATP-dependent Lhr-like helicase